VPGLDRDDRRLNEPSRLNPIRLLEPYLYYGLPLSTMQPRWFLIGAALVALSLPGVQCRIEWLKFDQNPVLAEGPEGSWDGGEVISVSPLREGEIYRMWYSADNGSELSGIGLATSVDRIHWTKSPFNPVLSNGPDAYDSGYVFAPCVLRDSEGYKMWYVGSDPEGVWTVCLATSVDGTSWTKHPQNPVLTPGPGWCDARNAGDPWVIFDDGLYKMWYTALNRTYLIAYATSRDGVHWTKVGPVLEPSMEGPDSSSVRGPCVLRTAEGYEMWYRGIGITSRSWTVCYAISPDGVNWERYAQNPVLEGQSGGWDAKLWFPRVIREEDRYSMWYTSTDSGVGQVGYAYLKIPEQLCAATVAGLVLCSCAQGSTQHRRNG